MKAIMKEQVMMIMMFSRNFAFFKEKSGVISRPLAAFSRSFWKVILARACYPLSQSSRAVYSMLANAAACYYKSSL